VPLTENSLLIHSLNYLFITATKKRKNRNKGEGRKHSHIATIAEAPSWRILAAVSRPKKVNVTFTAGMTPEAPMTLSQEGKGFHPLHP
jgi:hypothetical protein